MSDESESFFTRGRLMAASVLVLLAVLIAALPGELGRALALLWLWLPAILVFVIVSAFVVALLLGQRAAAIRPVGNARPMRCGRDR